MEENTPPHPRRSVDLSGDAAQRSRDPLSNASTSAREATSPAHTASNTPVTTPGSSALLESSTSYTMIYPIRSLLSDVQPSDATDAPKQPQQQQQSPTSFPYILPTPSLASASMPDPMKQRFQPESTPGASLHRSSSIQQRRTAQWQANISDRRSSGKLSAPSSPETRSTIKPLPVASPTGLSTSGTLITICIQLTSQFSLSSVPLLHCV